MARRLEEELGPELLEPIDLQSQQENSKTRSRPSLAVALDGAFIRSQEEDSRHIELIVGNLLRPRAAPKCFGLVMGYDQNLFRGSRHNHRQEIGLFGKDFRGWPAVKALERRRRNPQRSGRQIHHKTIKGHQKSCDLAPGGTADHPCHAK